MNEKYIKILELIVESQLADPINKMKYLKEAQVQISQAKKAIEMAKWVDQDTEP